MIDKGQGLEFGQDTGVTPLIFTRLAMRILMTTESQDLLFNLSSERRITCTFWGLLSRTHRTSTLFELVLARAFVHGRSSLHPFRTSRMRVVNYLDDWLILAQSQDTPASHIEKLLRHLESLRLCVNMRKSIIAQSQPIMYLGVCFD